MKEIRNDGGMRQPMPNMKRFMPKIFLLETVHSYYKFN